MYLTEILHFFKFQKLRSKGISIRRRGKHIDSSPERTVEFIL